jgi:hypothetical protein
MNSKSIAKKPKNRKTNSVTHASRTLPLATLKMRYKFWILIGVLVLAGIAIVMRIETPVVWTFLYGIGGWAALTTNPGSNLR